MKTFIKRCYFESGLVIDCIVGKSRFRRIVRDHVKNGQVVAKFQHLPVKDGYFSALS